MLIKYSRTFKKEFKKLPRHVVTKFKQRLDVYLLEPRHPLLHNHRLSGVYKHRRSINITGDYRLVFMRTNDVQYLEAVGTHSELYN